MISLWVVCLYLAVCTAAALAARLCGLSFRFLGGLPIYFLPQPEEKPTPVILRDKASNGSTTDPTPGGGLRQRPAAGGSKKERAAAAAAAGGGPDEDDNVSQLNCASLSPELIHPMAFFEELDRFVTCVAVGLAAPLTCHALPFLPLPPAAARELLGPSSYLLAWAIPCAMLGKCLLAVAKVQFQRSTTSPIDICIAAAAGAATASLLFAALHSQPGLLLGVRLEEAAADAGEVLTQFRHTLDTNVTAPASGGAGGSVLQDLPPVAVSVAAVEAVLAVAAGTASALLLHPALRLARCYWLAAAALDHNSDILVLRRHWLAQAALHLAFLLPILSSFLWVKPMAELFVLQPPPGPPDSGDDWAAGLGLPEAAFRKLQVAALLASSLALLAVARVQVQTYLSSGVLKWYEALHTSREVESRLVRHRVYAANFYLCKVALQSLLPGVVLLLLVAMASVWSPDLDASAAEREFFMPPMLCRECSLILAWAACAAWAFHSALILAMLRAGRIRAV